MAVSLSALQENIVTLLCYDDQRCIIIRNIVPLGFWSGPYAVLAPRIYEYIDRFKKAPKDHIADLMADKLEDKKNSREINLYGDILLSIKESYEGINPDYIMSQLEIYVKRQAMRSMAIDFAKAVQQDTDESLEEAERLLNQAKHHQSSVFDAGLRLSNTDKVLEFLDQQSICFPTGIPEFDKRGFGPTRKELWLYIAAAKRGKTWMLIQLAKMAVIHRLRVCHLTLEMSQERSAQRYMQAFFAMSKRKEKKIATKFKRDSLGRMVGYEEVEIVPSLSMDDPKIRAKLKGKIAESSKRYLDNIFVKQFATGTLTVRKVISYLDNLESIERFVPDLLIIDYPDLMKIDKDNFRLGIDEVYKELRGIAVERNLALAVVSQGNRSSEKAKQVTGGHVAEAWSKIAHADCIITYNQTEAEHRFGLARLYVSGGRNDEDKISLVISQNYAIGTFVVDSILMPNDYFKLLPQEEDDE